MIRDLGGGQLYRGSVELGEMEIAGDLRARLEEQAEVQAGDTAELGAINRVIADVEQRVIQEVEEVSPQFKVRILSDSRPLDDPEVPLRLTRAVEL